MQGAVARATNYRVSMASKPGFHTSASGPHSSSEKRARRPSPTSSSRPRLLQAEQQRGPEFVRLANAPPALYPQGSKEKRLSDAMLLAVLR